MFDIGWTEMMVVAVVAILFVGPKELPGMLRTFGRAVKKLRSCPFWRGMTADEEVEAGYRNALSLLDEGDVKKTTGFRLTTSF